MYTLPWKWSEKSGISNGDTCENDILYVAYAMHSTCSILSTIIEYLN